MAQRNRPRRLIRRPRLEGLESRQLLATFVVNSTADTASPPQGTITLRSAILASNLTPGPNTITFNLSGSTTIAPASPLPDITKPVEISGLTQPGYAGKPVVVLDGSGAGGGANGLSIAAAGVAIRGLDIVNFSGTGIQFSGPGGDAVTSCYIGIDAGGTAAAPNQVGGILITTTSNITIGGSAAAGNVISGNANYGIYISNRSNSIVVSYNKLGTNAAGSAAVANGVGLNEQLSTAVLASFNTVSGNTKGGISLQSGSGNVVWGNLVGTDATGESAIPNTTFGVNVQSETGSFVGLKNAAANVISGNAATGVLGSGAGVVVNGSAGTLVANNFIGLDKAGTKALGNGGDGILVEAAARDTSIGGVAGLGNFLSGNVGNGINVQTQSTGTLVQGDDIGSDVTGLVGIPNGQNGIQFVQTAGTVQHSSIVDNAMNGILLFGNYLAASGALVGSTIQSNLVGDVQAGKHGNGQDGIFVYASSNNVIAGNVVSSNNTASTAQNPYYGIEVQSNTTDSPNVLSRNNLLVGNLVGLDIVGNPTRPNSNGIGVFQAPGTTIGGTTFGASNYVGANTGYGIVIQGSGSTGTVIQGNVIGLAPNSTPTPAPNGNGGIALDGVAGAFVLRNIISANAVDGIYINGGAGSVIRTNLIGTDLTGTKAAGNGADGINVVGAVDTFIGGAAGDRNTISANKGYGIQLSQGAARTNISSNTIGTDLSGKVGLGNTQSGIWVDDVPGTVIGGSLPQFNVITDNGQHGILVTGAGSNGTAIIANFVGLRLDGVTVGPNTLDGILVQGTVGVNISYNFASGNADYGVHLAQGASQVVLAGNEIGVNVSGTTAAPNGQGGVLLDGVSGNTIGGTQGAGSRNIISGNKNAGLSIFGATASGNVVQGNYIGVNAQGNVPVPNALYGVSIEGPNNTIGGTAPGAGNVISGNLTAGVYFHDGGTNNVVAGNLIGTDSTGSLALGNGFYGVFVDGTGTGSAANNAIGLGTAASRNVISASGSINVLVLGPGGKSTRVAGNLIGTNLAGNLGLGRTAWGVVLNGAPSNTVGGTAAGAGNTICGSSTVGLWIVNAGASSNLVQGNIIGRAPAASATLANALGVLITNAPNNTVGGAASGAANTIVGNGSNPIQVTGAGATGNQTTGNIIGA